MHQKHTFFLKKAISFSQTDFIDPKEAKLKARPVTSGKLGTTNKNESNCLGIWNMVQQIQLTWEGCIQMVILPWKLAISNARGQDAGDHSIK